MRLRSALPILVFLLYCGIVTGQPDKILLDKIIQEADSNSTIRNSIVYLSDVYGPRLMGTPNYHKAAQWAKSELEKWGIDQVRLENFHRDHVGWTVEDFSLQMITPSFSTLAGMIRGVFLNGNEEIGAYFAEYLAPFPKSQTLTLQNANQTDHELFDYFNVPAFQFIQDPLDYMTAIHHTNMDVFEYVPLKDQVHNAKVIAYLAHKIAGEEFRLPRKKFNSPLPSREGNVAFSLTGFGEAQRVTLVGDFNNWNMFGTPLYRTETGWECKIQLPRGKYFYKYIIDGYWTADPKTPTEHLVKDGKGHGGLTGFTVE